MPRIHLWHPWPARNWPLNAEEEIQFVVKLSKLAARPVKTFERGDITAVINSLRSGMYPEELLGYAPGLRPARLWGAYTHLDTIMQSSLTAWTSMSRKLSSTSISDNLDVAARLLPVPSAKLVVTFERQGTPEAKDVLKEIKANMKLLRDRSNKVESRISSTGDADQLVELGKEIYDPYSPGIWGEPLFLPIRVTELSPIRIRSLLKEKVK